VAKKIVELSEKTAALVKKALETAKNPKEKSVHKVRSNLEPAGGEFISPLLLYRKYSICILVVF
jgi:hypothetical protein